MTAVTSSTRSPTPSAACSPRVRVASLYRRDLSEAVAGTASAAGIDLLPWQVEMLRDWTAVGEDGRFVHHRCGASIPRQAGKSVSGIAWCVALASVMGYKVLWTDHNYSTTCEMLNRFRKVFGSKPADPDARHPAFNRRVVRVNNKTAQESYEFKGGGVLAFSTRTKSAALGFSFDVVVYDEAQELRGEHVQAIQPTTSSGAKRNPQFIYLGTPTRAGSSAEVFQDIRAEALSDPGDDLCWCEYGVDEVGDVADEARWAEANPSLGALANADAIRAGMRSMPELAFAQEYLGYWLPKVADAVLTPKEWGACEIADDDSPKEGGRVAYGVKFSPDGATVALAAARVPDEGRAHVELVALESTSKGTAWLADWVRARSGDACCCVIDGMSGADALVDRIGRAPRGYVVRAGSADAVASAAAMLDAVREGAVTHLDDPALNLSATSATRRPIGGRGGWGWGGENAAPIEACGLALRGARKSKRRPGRKLRVG